MKPTLSTRGDSPTFIVNRNAGAFRRNPRILDTISRRVGGSGRVLATSTLAELDEVARDVVSSQGLVVLCGGDGTYLASITALVRAAGGLPLPPIALAAGGTVNIVATNWGGYPDIERGVQGVLERPDSLRFVPRPTLAVKDTSGGEHVAFTFGTGLVANFFTEYERAGAGGYGTAVGIALRAFFGSFTGGAYAAKILSPLPCRLTVDGRLLAPDAFSLVVMSVLKNVGMHFLVTYRAGDDPARPHLVASPLPPRVLGPQSLRALRGLPLVGGANFDGLVGECRVDFDSDRGPYILDGDAFHARSVTITAGPELSVATYAR